MVSSPYYSDTRIFLSPPHLSGEEEARLQEVLDSNYIAPVGPMLERFEADFCRMTGFADAVALNSGTAALLLALRGLGVTTGDRVWTSTLTFIGGVTPIVQLGAEPVFFDVDPETWTLDPALLAAELAHATRQGGLPKVVVPTDLYGQSCDLDALIALCSPYGVAVVTDSAEAVGSRYRDRAAGKGAAAAAYSFNGNKIITTSGGGMLASDNRKLVAQARFLAQQARDPAPHYQHSTLGYNARLSNVLAGVGVAQLAVLPQRVAQRRAVFARYQAGLADVAGLRLMPEAAWGVSNRWLTVAQIDPEAFGASPEQVRLALEAANIESRPVWKPMHLQPVFATARRVGGAVAERLFARGLCLPSGSALTTRDIDRIVALIRSLAAA